MSRRISSRVEGVVVGVVPERDVLPGQLPDPGVQARMVLLHHSHAVSAAAGRTGPVTVLGVQGGTYGTVLVDVEAGRVVDVLPDRTSETFVAWPRDHPGAEII